MPSGVVGSPGRDRGTVSSFNAQGPIGPKGPTTMSPKTWQGNTWASHHHHHRFHNRVFFGAGFAGPYDYDYGYDSCWRIVPTYWGGWRRVWVCDYPYPYSVY
jgi:hypothetical protein